MEDLLLELLGWILELLLEALFDYLIAGFADLILRSMGEMFEKLTAQNPKLASVGYLIVGLMCGGLSLLVFPHRLLHPTRMHGASLLISPILAGLMMAATGAILRGRDKKSTQFESFGYGFLLAFGVALIRFFFAK